MWPDIHGHYRYIIISASENKTQIDFREPKYSQTKHHWWWKANQIFHKLRDLENYTGPVLFIEEDHYLAPDFLQLLDMMQYHKQNHHDNVGLNLNNQA